MFSTLIPAHTLQIVYAQEREQFWQLEIPLDYMWARHWYFLLCERFEMVAGLSFSYVYGQQQDTRRGSMNPLDACELFDRRAVIYLYPPHYLRTLGHEFCHALRWIKHGKRGHGDSWLYDLDEVHSMILKDLEHHRPQSDLPSFYENKYKRQEKEMMRNRWIVSPMNHGFGN